MPLSPEEKARIQQRLQTGSTSTPAQPPSGLPPDIEAMVRSVPGTSGYAKSLGPRGGQVAPARSAEQVQGEMRQKLLMDQAQEKLKALNKPAKSIPSHQLDTIKSAQDAESLLNNIITDMEQHHYKTGPLSPRFYSGKLGNVAMQYLGSSEESSFKKKVKDYQNLYSHVQTGANRGFKEIEFLNAALPGADQDVPEKFLDAAYQARDRMQSNRESMRTLLEESGYKVPKFSEEGGRVKVVSPDGKVGTIPHNQLDAAQKKGFHLVH